MARTPRKGSAGSKKRGKTGASGRRNASKRPQKHARKSAAKPAKASKSNHRAAAGSALARELSEARARQAATAEILKIIASSPSDVQPVFEAIASSANRLLGGHVTSVLRVVEGNLHLAAFTPLNPRADAVLKSFFPAPPSAMPWVKRRKASISGASRPTSL